MEASKAKKPEEKRPVLKRDKKTGRIPGIITMGDVIDDMDRKKDKKK